ncbi:MAG: alginate export family protein [Candidatus Schekmanbacteria bacterium]|nr:alginate export family protein [Candidatus Schekmanbacteria bacterium]
MKKVGVALVMVLALCLLPLSSVKAETKADVENRLDQIEKEIAALKKEVSGQKEAWEKNMGFLKSIKLGGEVRTRWEIQNNFDFAKNNTDDFFLMRTRFSIEATPIDNLRIFIQAQDARVWGDEENGLNGWSRGGDSESQRTASDDRIDLKQGYFDLQNIGGLPVTVRVGRQVLSYGDERLVGANDWSNFGRSFDALKLIINPAEGAQVDVFYSKVVESIRDNRLDEDSDIDFYGIYGTTTNFADVGIKTFDLYALILRDNGFNNDDNEKPGVLKFPAEVDHKIKNQGNSTIYTVGARMAGVIPVIEAIDYNLEYAAQYGTIGSADNYKAVKDAKGNIKKDKDGKDIYKKDGTIPSSNLNAWAVHSEVGYSMPDFMMKPRIAAFFNYATGDAVPGDKRNTTFVNLFPTNHDKYGMIDFMRWQNMQDIGGNLTITPIESLTAKIAYHRLWLAKKNDAWYGSPRRDIFFVTNANRKGDGDNNVGDEIDLLLKYTYNKYVALEAGYSVFFAGDLVKRGGTADDGGKAIQNHKTEANWGYVQAKIGF